MSEYKSSTSLQTPIPSVSSVTLGIAGTSDPTEARFWTQKYGLGTTYGTTPNKFSHPRSLNFKTASGNAMVSQVLFGPTKSLLAVVSGPRVSLYGASSSSFSSSAFSRALSRHNTQSVTNNTEQQQLHDIPADRQVGTGGNPAHCAAFRSDGRLLAVGTDRGEVRVCDATSRATLCTFETTTTKTGKLPIRTVSWLRDGKQLISGGDDGLVRLWNLSHAAFQSKQALLSLRGHGDAIRSAVLWQQPGGVKTQQNDKNIPWKTLVMSGSYDHTIRVWNLDNVVSDINQEDDEDRCLAVLTHGAPVEALLLMPNKTQPVPWLLSAGGNTIKIWNPLTGVCTGTVSTQHSKTITSLVAMRRNEGEGDSTNDESKKKSSWRVLTTGLDGLVRIHKWNDDDATLQHVHGVKLSEPITSLAVSDTSERLVIGTTAGLVLVRQRGPSISPSKRKREPRAGTYAYFTRGTNVAPDTGDYIALQDRKRKQLKSFDVALKQFRYGDALDEALDTRQPQAVVAVLEELGKRRGLTIAISNRDEESLEPILSFTVRYIARPQFSSLLIGVAHKLCDIYGGVAGQSETIDELFEKLRNRVREECRVQRSLLKLVGQLDGIMTMAEMQQQAYQE